MATAWRAALRFDGRPSLAELRCPTLVLAGARDRTVPAHRAEMLRHGIPGTRPAVVERAGHSFVWAYLTS